MSIFFRYFEWIVFEYIDDITSNIRWLRQKNKKRVSAERVHSKKEKLRVVKPQNPFEVHINKEKLKVLGKKQKNDKGLPGVSRAKALEKRKNTLLQEYKVKDKSNHFTDKRIGEKSKNMSNDDKLTARFTAVRLKANRKSIFNLADDEILTHRGQTLNEIEKFDDPRSDDEDSLEGDPGRLGDDFVEAVHFGGGMLKKTGVEGALAHKDVINQLIADSKKKKAEKQKLKEVTLELTEKLDNEWKDLIPLVNTKKKTDQDSKPDIDDYDKIMRELKFEARGSVSDRLKTEEEIAEEEKEKLEALEQERLQRMKGFQEEAQTKQHRSADDLDDDFITEDLTTDNMLSYNEEGESNVPVAATINGKQVSLNGTTDHSSEDDSAESDENEDLSDEESEDNFSDLKSSSDSEEEAPTDNNGTNSDMESVGNIDVEHHAEEFDIQEKNKNQFTNVEAENVSHNEAKGLEIEEERKKSQLTNSGKKQTADEIERLEVMKKAGELLLNTYPLPESYESLQVLLEDKPSLHQSIIIERIIKCNHPSLAEGNKDGLGLLLAYILQYLNDIFSASLDKQSIARGFDILKAIAPRIFDLAQLIPDSAHKSVVEVIKEKHDEYRIKKVKSPGIEVLIFLKLVSILFSTSDFRHQIVSPCFIFMEQILSYCRIQKKCDIAYGFYIVTLVLEYTAISKRYLPAAVTYLSGLLHMTIPKSSVRLIKVSNPFNSTSSLLVLCENCSLEDVNSLKMQTTDLVGDEVDKMFKIRILYNILHVIEQFCEQLSGLPSNVEIFESICKFLEMIPINNYPMVVQDRMKNLTDLLSTMKAKRQLQNIVMAAAKPKALRLYEPKIEEVYDGKRHKVQSKEKAERSKLIHKLKKEKKGALREIRRDKAFLGRVKIKQKIQSDTERREKVKRIYAEAANQQSELNELDRKKKRKK